MTYEKEKAQLRALLGRGYGLQPEEVPAVRQITLPPPPIDEASTKPQASPSKGGTAEEYLVPEDAEVRAWATPRSTPEPEPEGHPIQTDEGVIYVPRPDENLKRFVAVHTPEVQLVSSAGQDYNVRTGRVLISWRLRRPDDGDAPFVYADPQLRGQTSRTPPPVDPEKKAEEDRKEWLRRTLRGESLSDVQWAPGKVGHPEARPLTSGSFGGSWRRPGDR